MKLELAEMQHKMEDRSHRSPEVSEQKEQAETKEQKRAEKQVDEAVSVISNALQQHATFKGGQQPSRAPAAAGVADMAAALHRAAAHFEKACGSSREPSGTAPAHAPVSGTPQPQAHATTASTVSKEARQQRLVLVRGEVAARKIAQEAAEKALSEEKVCDTSEKIAAVSRRPQPSRRPALSVPLWRSLRPVMRRKQGIFPEL